MEVLEQEEPTKLLLWVPVKSLFLLVLFLAPCCVDWIVLAWNLFALLRDAMHLASLSAFMDGLDRKSVV